MDTSLTSALIKGGVVQGRLKPGAVYQDGKKWQHSSDNTILIKKQNDSFSLNFQIWELLIW